MTSNRQRLTRLEQLHASAAASGLPEMMAVIPPRQLVREYVEMLLGFEEHAGVSAAGKSAFREHRVELEAALERWGDSEEHGDRLQKAMADRWRDIQHVILSESELLDEMRERAARDQEGVADQDAQL